MKQLGSTAAVAFALATVYLLFLTGPLVSPQHQLIFHLPGSATALFLPVILDLLLATLVLFAALWAVHRQVRARLLLWAILLLPIPLVAVQTIASFTGRPANAWFLWGFLFCAFAGLGFTAARPRSLLPHFGRLRRVVISVSVFASFSGLLILVQLVWFGWAARGLNPTFITRPNVAAASSSGTPAPRVVWVILDELSFRQVYGARAPGLQLPNFDRLAAQATVLTDSTAAAQYTRVALPALLTGLPLNETSPNASGQHLLLHRRGDAHWLTFNPQQTVFGDAFSAGLPTGIVGWYEPYCRLLAPVLNRCFWTYRDNTPGGLSADAPLWRNLLAPLNTVLFSARAPFAQASPSRSEDALDVARHTADFRELTAQGDRLLHAQTSGLILLHMPIPHPWGIYDRRTGRLSRHRTSYLDNLALADAWLGHLCASMQADSTWNNTTLVVMGDHGWRADAVWKRSGFWTAEDEQASQGASPVDPPAVIVRLAGQHTPARTAVPFDAVRTRSLLDALLRRSITTPAQLEDWLAHPVDAPATR